MRLVWGGYKGRIVRKYGVGTSWKASVWKTKRTMKW